MRDVITLRHYPAQSNRAAGGPGRSKGVVILLLVLFAFALTAPGPAFSQEDGAVVVDGAAAGATLEATPDGESPAVSPMEAPSGLAGGDPIAAVSEDEPHDLTPIGMFLAADRVVKGVLIGLMGASVLTWTVCLVKSVEVFRGGRRLSRLSGLSDHATSPREFHLLARGSRAPEGALFRAALEETMISARARAVDHQGVMERVSSRLSREEARLTRRMNQGTGLLAIIGSTAPFIGLFGTVWGIMNAFVGISKSQTTNLAVVAPGIAEALLATAIGLVAAIPAVLLYNLFARAIAGYRAGLADLSAEVERKVARDMEARGGVHALAEAAE